jgi:ATPase subunit of ABC transporter with duplicated ATPase domains
VQAAAAKKQEAERAHLQAFVDRFKAKASKAKQAQSRVKMLERMTPIRMPEDARARCFLPRARGAVAAHREPRRGGGGLWRHRRC